MDQIKIGKFIKETRKNQKLTQSDLAEKLNVSDRAISKWENGQCMPDVSIMLDLCNELKINVNELLSGKKMNIEDNNKEQEQLLLNIVKEVEEKNKIIWTSMWVILIISMIALFISLFLTAFLIPEEPIQLIIIIAACILFLTPCFYALKLEVSVGSYKCRNCGYEIIPSYKDALWAMHSGTTRRLKCPKCSKRTWCKKIINK